MNNIDIVDMDILKDEELFELNKSSIKMCLEMEYGIDVERENQKRVYKWVRYEKIFMMDIEEFCDGYDE